MRWFVLRRFLLLFSPVSFHSSSSPLFFFLPQAEQAARDPLAGIGAPRSLAIVDVRKQNLFRTEEESLVSFLLRRRRFPV